MNARFSSNESGAALFLALVALVMGLALSSAMVSYALADSRGMRRTQEFTQAFYVAESGLQGARYELAEHEDSAKDGEGTRTGSLGSGSYTVTALSLGGQLYRLTSRGLHGSEMAVIEEVVEVRPTSGFPGGAISMVGDMTTTQMLFGSSTDLVVDGGKSPGVVFSDPDLYSIVTKQFAQAVGLGYVQETDITGSITNTFQPNDVDLSMSLYSNAGHESLTIYPEIYTEFFNHIDNNLQGSASHGQLGTSSYVFGTQSSPVNYAIPGNQKLKAGQTVSGYGTLIFSQNLVLEAGSRIDWNGNLIIFGGDNSSDVLFECDGILNVTGNIIIVGPEDRSLKFLIKSQGAATVTGAMTVLGDLSNTASKIDFYVEGDLAVNGLLTTVASKIQTEFRPGSDTTINGSFQLGRPYDAVTNTELQLKFDGPVEVHKDEDLISAGAAALEALGGNLSIPVIGDNLNKDEVVTRSWRMLPSQ